MIGTYSSFSLPLILVAHKIRHSRQIVTQAPAEGYIESLAFDTGGTRMPGMVDTPSSGYARYHDQDEHCM